MSASVVFDTELARRNLLTQQVRAMGVLDDTVLYHLQHTPREWFVPEAYQEVAFAEMTIPLGHDQYMFHPSEEGRFLQALSLKPHHRVLEIGTGSGYFTALLAKQVAHVDSIDCFSEFTTRARSVLARCGLKNVTLITKQIFQEPLSIESPYDVVVIGGGLKEIPEFIYPCVAKGGILLAIVGSSPAMNVVSWRADSSGGIGSTHVLFETSIPMLVGDPARSSFTF